MMVVIASELPPAVRGSLLHVRGGVSVLSLNASISSDVFSTSVEVFPCVALQPVVLFGLLHVRGGVSRTPVVRDFMQPSSPRPWRCF